MNKNTFPIPLARETGKHKLKVNVEDINFEKVNMFKLFDALMESYCMSCQVAGNKYERTLKKIGQWVDEARDGYSIDY